MQKSKTNFTKLLNEIHLPVDRIIHFPNFLQWAFLMKMTKKICTIMQQIALKTNILWKDYLQPFGFIQEVPYLMKVEKLVKVNFQKKSFYYMYLFLIVLTCLFWFFEGLRLFHVNLNWPNSPLSKLLIYILT